MSTVTGNATSERLYGTSSNDTIYGMGGNDTIYGYAGNDKIDGGAGADSMIGGLGDDTYIIDNSGDIIVEAANQGTDTIIMTANIGNYHMPDNVEYLGMQVGSYATRAYDNDLDNIILGNERNNFLYGDKGNDTIYGEDGNDEIEDYSGNNLLDGGNGNDTIMAYGTNDTINGGAGDDSIFAYNKYSEIKGGNGNDIIAIRSNISEIDGGEGWDTVDIRDTVDKNDIAVYSYQKNGNTFLDIDYGVTVGKYKTTLSNVEVVKIAGNTVSTVVLNNIAQDVAAYITENGLNYTSVEEVKNDANLMNLINSAWS